MIDWDSCVLWLDPKYLSESYWWDRSQYRNDGVVYGATWKESAFYFDGVSDYINCGNDGSLSVGTHDFSIEAWVRGGEQDGCFVGKYTPFQLRYKDHKCKVFVYVNGEVKINWQSSDTSVDDNQWHHIVWVCDREDTSKIYVDGKLDGSPVDISQYSGEDWTCENNLVLGARDINGVSPFCGYIGEVRYFRKALTDDEIKILRDVTFRKL